jgi:hypothetical protein
MDDQQHKTRSARRPRISLLSALLLMTILGMAIVIVQLWREIRPMRTELRALRDEVGRLSIDDETKVHAIAVRTSDDLTWKWRVWVPQAMNVNLHYRFGQVPKTGVPPAQGGSSLGPGEHWIELKASRDRSGKNWSASLSTPGGGVSTSISPEDHWFDWGSMASTGDGVGTSTKIMDDDKSVFVLNRMRTAPVNSSAKVEKMEGPTAGFIIWLERRYNGGSSTWASSGKPKADDK